MKYGSFYWTIDKTHMACFDSWPSRCILVYTVSYLITFIITVIPFCILGWRRFWWFLPTRKSEVVTTSITTKTFQTHGNLQQPSDSWIWWRCLRSNTAICLRKSEARARGSQKRVSSPEEGEQAGTVTGWWWRNGVCCQSVQGTQTCK